MGETGGGWTTLSTRLPKELKRALKVYCVEEQRQLCDVIVEALRAKLAEVGGGGGRRRAE